MKRLPLLATLLAVLTVGAADAQRPGQGGFGSPPGVPGFGRGMRGPDFGVPGGFGILQYDVNADGKVTKAELDAAARKTFNELDGNKDGSATPEEIRIGMEAQRKAQHEAMLKVRFAEMDANKNGQLTEAEFLAAQQDASPRMRGPGSPGPVMVFGRGDRDGPRMERGRRFDGGPHGVPGGPPGAPGGQPPQGAQQGPMRAGLADADGDGKLTFAEFSAQRNEAFARADTNKDATVTLAELQARAGIPR
jgi:hypothetical protein